MPKIGSIPVPFPLYSNGLVLGGGVEPPLNPKFCSAKVIKVFTVNGVPVSSSQSAKGL